MLLHDIERRATSADASLVADDSSFRRLLGDFTSGLSSRFRLVAVGAGASCGQPRETSGIWRSLDQPRVKADHTLLCDVP